MPNNRANIYVKQGDGRNGVYLYTALDGPQMPAILKSALHRGRERWGDTGALTRIIFSELTQRNVFGTNDYGISTFIGDNENFILVVDDKKLKIGLFGESGQMYKSWSFDEYMAMPADRMDYYRLSGGARVEHDNGINRRRGDPYPL